MVDKYYVIDAHCHIYPDKIAERAVAGTSTFYDQPFAAKGTISDLMEVGTSAGIDKFIVQSVATTPHQVGSINNFIAESVKTSGGKFIGFGTLHPDTSDLSGDIEQLKDLGLRGVKLHPDIQAFKIDDYRCLKIYERCEKENIPILMHTGDHRYDYSNPNRLLPVLKIYTGLTVIGAHFGGWSVWDEAVEKLAEIENFYVDCSSSMQYISSDKTRELISRYGADHVLFGTDYPMWSPSVEIENLLKLNLTDTDYQKIFSLNAKKLFNIGD